MKQFLQSLKVLLVVLFSVFSSEAFGQYTGAGIFNKISSTAELTDGYYVIAGNGSTNKGLMLNTSTGATGYINQTSVTTLGASISNPSINNVFKIIFDGTNYTIYNEAQLNYVSLTNGTSNSATFVTTVPTTKEKWTVTQSGGLFEFVNTSFNARKLYWNNSSPRFACYTTTQVPLTLYKLAAPISKTVTFNSNGGTGTMANQTSAVAANLTTNSFSRTGHAFQNWNTAAVGGGTTYTNGQSYDFNADMTLYAQWSANNYTITYNGNGNTGGTAPADQAVTYNATATVAANTGSLTRTDYSFNGWNTNASGTGTHYAEGATFPMPPNNVPLYAEWLSITPVLTSSKTNLTGFTYAAGAGPSASQSFVLNGTNLNGTDVGLLLSGADFEISMDGITYSDFINYTAYDGTAKTVYVRLRSGLPAATYNDEIIISGGGAADTGVTLSGEVKAPSLTVSPTNLSGFTYPQGSGPSNTLNFSLTGTNLNGSQNVELLPGDNWQISTDQSTWIGYNDGPLVINNYNGSSTSIYVRLKAGLAQGTYNNASNDIIVVSGYGIIPSPEVALAGTVTAPAVTTAMTADGNNSYSYVEGNGPSVEKSYHISGNNLTANLVLTPPVNYEVSLTTGAGFGSSVTLTPVSGTVSSTQVFVRLKSGLTANSYNGNLILSTTGITDKTLALSGSVTIPVPANDLCADPATLAINNGTASNGTLKGSTVTTPFSGADMVDVWYKFTVTHTADYTITVAGFSGDIDFDLFTKQCPASANDSFIITSAAVVAPEVLTRNLTAGTYYIRVFSFNAAAATSAFTIAVTAPRTLTSAVSSLAFGNVNKGTNSAVQSVNVSGAFLANNATVTVTAPIHYEVSTTGTANDFHSTVNVTADGEGFLVPTPVYVRFNTADACGATLGDLSITSAGATTVNVGLTGTAFVPATTATVATGITDDGFTANWGAVADATSYKVNIYKKTVLVTNTDVTATFANYGFANMSTYPGGSITGGFTFTTEKKNSVTAPAYYDTGAGIRLYGNVASGDGNTLTLNIPNNITVTKIDIVKGAGSQASTYAYYVDGSGTSGGTGAFATGLGTNTISSIAASSSLVIQNTSTGASSAVRISSIKIYYIENGSTETVVVGSPFTVTAPATSYAVNGLDPVTEYFYTVEALVGTCSSVPSNEIAVTTKHDTTTWNGSVWDFDAPDATVHAIINGDYLATGHPVAKSLTINTGKTLTVAANTSFTTGDFTNNGTLIVESDGNFVQTEGSNNTGDGLATVKRTANIKRLDYVYWSSPVADQNLKAFSPGTLNNRFLTYNEWDDRFTPVFAATDPATATEVFTPAKGYAIRASNYQSATVADWTGTFAGKPNNGDKTFPLAFTVNGYNLVGNPYPSNIKLDETDRLFDTNTTVIEKIAYFWNNRVANPASQGADYNGENYAIYNLSGGNPGTSNTDKPDGTVKVGQGFIVKSRSTADGQDLVFKNSMRDGAETTSIFYDKALAVAKDRYWLQLTAPGQNFATLLVAYVPHATNGFELSYDAPIMSMGSDSFFSVLGERQLGIQGRKYPLNLADAVTLGSNHFVAGNYKISLQETEGIFANGQHIYLKDRQTGTLTNLSEGSYTFTANAGISEGRFEVVYENEVVLATGNSNKGELIVYKDGNRFVVKSPNTKMATLEMFDASGRLVLSLNPNQTEVQVDGSALVNGVYVLKIIRNGEVITKKVTK